VSLNVNVHEAEGSTSFLSKIVKGDPPIYALEYM